MARIDERRLDELITESQDLQSDALGGMRGQLPQLDDIARTRHVAVIAGSLDSFNLSAQEAAARALKARSPALEALFYFNTKHYFDQASHPNYMRGFDPASMALSGPDAQPRRFHVSSHRPNGIGWYVDETSPAWHSFYLRTARQIMAAGSFDGIAVEGGDPDEVGKALEM